MNNKNIISKIRLISFDMGLLSKKGSEILKKKDLQKRYTELEYKLSTQTIRKQKIYQQIKELQFEANRLTDNLDGWAKEMIIVQKHLSKL